MYYVVWPYTRDHDRKAATLSTHETVEDAYANLDGLAEVMSSLGCRPNWWFNAYVVDENRQPIAPPCLH